MEHAICSKDGCNVEATEGYVIEEKDTGKWARDKTRDLCSLHALATRKVAESTGRYLKGRLIRLPRIKTAIEGLNKINKQFENAVENVLTGKTLICPHSNHHHFGLIVFDKNSGTWIEKPDWRICGKCRKAAFRVQRKTKYMVKIQGQITHLDQIERELAVLQSAIRDIGDEDLGGYKQHLIDNDEERKNASLPAPDQLTDTAATAKAAKQTLLIGKNPLESGLKTLDESVSAADLEKEAERTQVDGGNAQSVDEAVDAPLANAPPRQRIIKKKRRKDPST